jgi:four helix bundle protein
MTDLIAKHGGYKTLKSFQNAELVFDLTFEFCRRFVKSFKMKEQMEGAARGGKQNISEGSLNSGTSKQTEIRLLNVARGSQEELKNDFEDYLRVNRLPI